MNEKILEQIKIEIAGLSYLLIQIKDTIPILPIGKSIFYQSDNAVINLKKIESMAIHWQNKNQIVFTIKTFDNGGSDWRVKAFKTNEEASKEYKRIMTLFLDVRDE